MMKFLMLILFLSNTSLAAQNNKELRIGILGSIKNFNPLNNSNEAENFFYSLTSKPLISLNKNWTWECILCETSPTVENGLIKITKKKMQITWTIKPAAKWSDGAPVTGYDALLAWEIGKSVFTKIHDPMGYGSIQNITVDPSDPKTFTTFFRNINYDHALMRSFYLVPIHLERSIWKAQQGTSNGFMNSSTYKKKPTNKGLYYGPYYLKEIISDKLLLLEKNPKYHGTKPFFEKIYIYSYQNITSLKEGILRDNIDFIPETNQHIDSTTALINYFKSNKKVSTFNMINSTTTMVEQLTLNLRNPILFDKSVRKALILSLDIQSILDLHPKTTSQVISILHPQEEFFTPYKTTFKLDLHNANKLLERSGWKLNKDGYRYKNHKRFKINIITTNDRKYIDSIVNKLIFYWKKIGLEINLIKQSRTFFHTHTLRRADYKDIVLFSWTQPAGFPPFSRYDSKEIPTSRNRYKGQNIGSWIRKNVDRTISKLKTELIADKRKELLTDLQNRYLSDIPYIPLYRIKRSVFFKKGIHGVQYPGHQFPSASSVENWVRK